MGWEIPHRPKFPQGEGGWEKLIENMPTKVVKYKILRKETKSIFTSRVSGYEYSGLANNAINIHSTISQLYLIGS